jgi:hypothetical protein
MGDPADRIAARSSGRAYSVPASVPRRLSGSRSRRSAQRSRRSVRESARKVCFGLISASVCSCSNVWCFIIASLGVFPSPTWEAMALLRTDKRSSPISELATKHQLHPNQMTQWRRQARPSTSWPRTFDDGRPTRRSVGNTPRFADFPLNIMEPSEARRPIWMGI